MEDLENISPLKKNAILILPVLLIVIFGVMYILIPLWDERSSLMADIEKQAADLQRLKAQEQRLKSLQEEHEAKKKELERLEAQLPVEKEVSELLKRTSDLGIKAGLDVVLWKPGAKVVHPSKEVYEIPVSVEMRGSYHSIGYFFSNITELPRIVTINGITLKKSGKGSERNPVTLSATFTAKTYSSIPEEEKKALQQAEKGKKK